MKTCPQTGSAAMLNKIQTAMVTVSCDDRQPMTPCQYTDLFDNLDWINKMTGNWKPARSTSVAVCSTCLYHFFIGYDCRNHYKDNQADLESNYRKVKATYDNDYKPRDRTNGYEYPEGENRDYQIKKPSVKGPDKKKAVESLQVLFTDARLGEDWIPPQFARLCKQFLVKHEQSKENADENFTGALFVLDSETL
ncbi:uncharacterized protein LOC131663571 [Phymastichus coffea]|uniref:uncharacterized protein LOC131663571 n=1 Tax=Phymastichus coffea TaxID=108790 RepID=UPI00273B9F11|nr:uncharacterized protein LOC131663571 [Phymastichus coffea]